MKKKTKKKNKKGGNFILPISLLSQISSLAILLEKTKKNKKKTEAKNKNEKESEKILLEIQKLIYGKDNTKNISLTKKKKENNIRNFLKDYSISKKQKINIIDGDNISGKNIEKKPIKSLSNTNELSNLKRVKVPGDGSCLYHSVAYFINKINKSGEMTGEKLRENVATFYENNEELLKKSITKDERDGYANKIRDGNEYGDQVEINILANMLTVIIEIYDIKEDKSIMVLRHYPENNSKNLPIFNLARENLHFEPLIPKKNEEEEKNTDDENKLDGGEESDKKIVKKNTHRIFVTFFPFSSITKKVSCKDEGGSKDHITIDTFETNEVKSLTREIIKEIQNLKKDKNFKITLKGDNKLQNSDIKDDFSTPLKSIESFRKRAKKISPDEFNYRTNPIELKNTVLGHLGKKKVQIVSCPGVGSIRGKFEKNNFINSFRKDIIMPKGKFIAHMTIGNDNELWDLAERRAKKNLNNDNSINSGIICLRIIDLKNGTKKDIDLGINNTPFYVGETSKNQI